MSVKPEILVGVDFGTAMTKVMIGYLCGTQLIIAPISNWPGGQDKEHPSLVPSAISYDTDGKAKAFGYECDLDMSAERLFKPKFPTDKASAKHIGAFLRFIYDVIAKEVAQHLSANATWEAAKVEFIFSVPAIWEPLVVDNFIAVVRQAGFEKYGHHRVRRESVMKEPVAAAVYTLGNPNESHNFRLGWSVLVVDVEGGTSDFFFGRVISKMDMKIDTDNVVTGMNIGSQDIDAAVEKMVVNLLVNASGNYDEGASPATAAWTLRQSPAFELFKHQLGTRNERELSSKMHGLNATAESVAPNGLTISQLGTITIPTAVLKMTFDNQLSEVLDKTNDVLRSKYVSTISEVDDTVHAIVLCGGLGKSKYFQHQFQKRLHQARADNAKPGIYLHLSTEPQLCVAHGLVLHRYMELEGQSKLQRLFNSERYEASIGVVLRTDTKVLVYHDSEERLALQEPSQPEVSLSKPVKNVKWIVKRGTRVKEKQRQVRFRYVTNNSEEEPRAILTFVISKARPLLNESRKASADIIFWVEDSLPWNLTEDRDDGTREILFDLVATSGSGDPDLDFIYFDGDKKIYLQTIQHKVSASLPSQVGVILRRS